MFENIDIDINSLPRVDTKSFISLDENYRTVLILKSLILSVVLIAVFILYYQLMAEKYPLYISVILFVLMLILVLGNIIFAYLGFKRKKYKLRLFDIIYKTGLLWRSETSIPFVRVQHSEVIQDPIERIFKLAKLKLYTAGGHSSDLNVPGLSLHKAEQLKEFVTKRIQEEEEE